PAAMQMAIYLTAGAMASLAVSSSPSTPPASTTALRTFESVAHGLQNAKSIPAATGALVLSASARWLRSSRSTPGRARLLRRPDASLDAARRRPQEVRPLRHHPPRPQQPRHHCGSLGTWFLWFAVANVVLVGLICLAQRDLKQLLSWSSVAHMGPIFLGIWVCGVSGKADGLDAAAFLMVAHGLSCAALFLLANAVRARAGTYRLDELGGLATRTPILAALFIAATMASIGLPGFGNFWGEVGIFLALRAQPLWLQGPRRLDGRHLRRVRPPRRSSTFFGPASEALEKRFASAPFGDLGWAERFAAFVLLGASLTIGFVPSLITKSVNPVAAGITTFSQHNAKAPVKAAPAQPAQS
ncbi:NAD(P)H-quinone oxidoreductase chain 4, chloroplastic, partial [Opitutia bacterium]